MEFYPSLKKVRKSNPEDNEDYKNSSMQCIRAALNCYFRETRGIDIISHQKFVKVNEMFATLTTKGKKEGRGEIKSKDAIR